MATPRADQKLARPLFIDRHVIAISKPSGVVSQMHGGLNKCARDHHEAVKNSFNLLVTGANTIIRNP